jgi:hypothetical protein
MHNGLQQPPAIAQGKAELLEVVLVEVWEDIDADIVCFERIGILLQIVPAQLIANFAHAAEFLACPASHPPQKHSGWG